MFTKFSIINKLFTVNSFIKKYYIIKEKGVKIMTYKRRLYELRIDNDLRQEDIAKIFFKIQYG